MYIKIKKIEKKEGQFGNKLLISMIGLYDDNDKYIKRIKLDDEAINILTTHKLVLDYNYNIEGHQKNEQKNVLNLDALKVTA